MKKGLAAAIISSSLLLSACQTPAIYYEDWYNPPVHWGYHTVQKGETLYRIAWRYGRDHRELGDANGLKPPYTIQEGQTIRLDLKGQIPVSSGESYASNPKPKPAAKVYVTDPDTNESVEVEPSKPKKGKPVNVPNVAKNLEWQWPHDGKVIRNYAGGGMKFKGINIAGKRGDEVKAAATGQVMYAGSGILGYGNMIILGHDAKTFSVYAHNKSLAVSEGDSVQAGQKIAEMGDSSSDRVKLYFEVRKGGGSVDPMKYLPKRS